jgi:3',5'-cyclic-AMP phosphodiesterase
MIIKKEASRREMLKGSMGLAAGLAAAGWGFQTLGIEPVAADIASPYPKRALRFAHPTDIHVQPELAGGEGMAQAFRHMMALKDPPAMILTGGDLPMDTASSEYARSDTLWKLFTSTLAQTVPANVPIHHTIGNHDIWGRNKLECGARGDEPHYLKRWFLDLFGYERTFQSFDMGGWHFIILDSFDLDEKGGEFTARIVGPQLEWFKADLATTPPTTPIVLITHVPILSVVNFFEKPVDDGPDITLSRTRMHTDHKELEALLRAHPNVKLCLSGHIHLLDRVEYNGITYICDGAVCGDKWNGPRRQTPEGYGLIDLYDDGTFQHQYVTYGWKAKKD